MLLIIKLLTKQTIYSNILHPQLPLHNNEMITCRFNKWRLTLKYERRFVRVCKHMNGEFSGPARLRTENRPGVKNNKRRNVRTVNFPYFVHV